MSNKPNNKRRVPKNQPQKTTNNQPTETSDSQPTETSERVQKVLARGGLGSRREIEGWIKEELLTINGIKVTLGQSLKTGDILHIKGRVRVSIAHVRDRASCFDWNNRCTANFCR